MERRISVSSFQPPNFEGKKHLDDAVKIADEIVEVMRPDMETNFKVCSGYVLSSIPGHLSERGFKVEEVEATGELQEKVERSYTRWCKEVGVPAERRGLGEAVVKTGWKSWKQKWREKARRHRFS